MHKPKRTLLTKRILILLLLFISSLSYARKYYVSTSGNDANNGLTTATPWKTIQYAEAHAISAGDTIALKRGDIWSSTIALGIHHGGTIGSPVTWDGTLWGSGAKAIIRSSGDRSGDSLSIVNIIGCSYVTFQNITVDGNNTRTFGLVIGGHTGFSGNIQNAENHISILNCSILNCGNGTCYELAFTCQTFNNAISDITIKGCTLDGSDDEQLSFYNGRSNNTAAPSECKNVYIGYNTLTNWGRRGTSTGYGLQINNKITDVIIEHNTLTTGINGHGNAIHIESNEPNPGWFPTGVIVRYNKINATLDNTFCIYITQGQAKSVDVYCNQLYSSTKTTNGGGIWVVSSTSPDWTGAKLNFYNNTIYTLAGRSFTNDCAVAGVVTFKNNLLYNTGTDDYGMMCLANTTAGATTHSNNLYYRSANVSYTKVKDGGSYAQTSTQVLTWEPTAKVTDPFLVTPGTDFHLQAGSPAIGTGVAIPGLTKDIEGVTFSNTPDIGCFQSHSNLSPPIYKSSVVENATPSLLDMTYDVALDNSVVPPASVFDVKIYSVSVPVNSVAIVGGKVRLTLSSDVILNDIVTVSYTKTATNPLQTPSGGLAASNYAQLVTNNTTSTITQINTGSNPAKINMNIYPNPANHIVNISLEYPASSIVDAINSARIIRIYDLYGKLVSEKLLDAGVNNVQIPINFKSGVYIVQTLSGGLPMSSHKLLVNN